MKEKILLTAGLPYANGDIHVGHIAGCYLPADIFNRYFKLKGQESYYICGTDDHGAAIVLSGLELKKSPQEIVKYYHDRQKKAFAALSIDFDIFGHTSSNKRHENLSHQFFLKIHEKGLLTKETSEQFYDETQQLFLPDRYVKGDCSYCGALDQNGDQCDQCGKLLDVHSLKNPKNVLFGNPVLKKQTSHWYLDLTKLEKEIEEWLTQAEVKEVTKHYVKGLLKQGLVKRSMTRDLDWGLSVPLADPEAKGKVLYVWFDAPIGYLSNTQEFFKEALGDSEKFEKWCKYKGEAKIYHFVGEDNTIFHCLIWVAMLKIQGEYNLPAGVLVNKFMNLKQGALEEKISKSKKNAIWIYDFLEWGHSPDCLRYYLTKISPEKERTSFDKEEYFHSCNADLADTLGNFISRTVAFLHKFLGDKIPDFKESFLQPLDKEHLEHLHTCFERVEHSFKNWSTKEALEAIFHFARQCNKYFNDKAPWNSRKNNETETTCITVALSLQSIYFLGHLLRPFLPSKSEEILSLFGIKSEKAKTLAWEKALELPRAGHPIAPLSGVLFPKLEM